MPQQLSSSSGRPTPRLLVATETVPIRIWVEYQGIDSLSADGKQHLQNVVKISLGVLQKFYKVRLCPAALHRSSTADLYRRHRQSRVESRVDNMFPKQMG